MTKEDLKWEPCSNHFIESEAAITNLRESVSKIYALAKGKYRVINTIEVTYHVDEGSLTSNYQFISVLKSNV